MTSELEAHDLTKELLSDWSLTNNDYAYTLYQSKLDHGN
ncbi:hypothetical protein RV10_GL002003 [Enterococcus pallens]|nr:hypothetical protein RV10_GL002003 [Enterococcus pallens]